MSSTTNQSSSIPQTMQVWRVNKYASKAEYKSIASDALVLVRDFPVPAITADQVLVKIYRASMNPVDFKFLQGYLPFVSPPYSAGLDLAGVVVSVGEDVKRLKVGDRVYGSNDFQKQGAFGEYVNVNQNNLSIIPDQMSFDDASSIPVVSQTSFQALFEKGKLQQGQKVLILGASGGTGIFAVQLAKNIGASEVAATSSERNAQFVRDLGATVVIDYARQNWWEELKNQQYDVVFDCVGENGSYEHALDIMKPSGQFVTIAAHTQVKSPNFHFMYVSGNFESLDKISALFTQGKLRTVIEKTYPFEQCTEMFLHSMTGRVRGKLVLAVAN